MDKFCIPIEKKPERCGECAHLHFCGEYDEWYCVILKEFRFCGVKFIPNCPVVPMPDVEGLIKKIATILNDTRACPHFGDNGCFRNHSLSCDECWREYLESKLKEREDSNG